MDRKLIIIIAAAAVLILCSGIAVFALSGKEEKKRTDMPLLSSFPDESVDLTVSQAEILEGGDYFFPLGSSGTNVTLLYSIRLSMTWTDDEQAPAYRPMYSNEPDTFTATVLWVKAGSGTDPNGTANTTSSSSVGNMALDLTSGEPGFIMGTGGMNWSIPASGATSMSANDTVYIKVSVVPGDIRRSGMPAALLYNDFGDQIDMRVNVRYKTVPLDVYEHYYGSEAAGAEG
jgi:hypothetical protein